MPLELLALPPDDADGQSAGIKGEVLGEMSRLLKAHNFDTFYA